MQRKFQFNDNVTFIASEKKLVRLSDGHTVQLRSPASFCLLLLLEKQGSLVSHNELFHYGWERFGMSASFNVLHNTIFHLRKSLYEVGGFDNKTIETMHRRGFVFTTNIKISFFDSDEQYADEPDSLLFNTDETSIQQTPKDESNSLENPPKPENKKPYNQEKFSENLSKDIPSINKKNKFILTLGNSYSTRIGLMIMIAIMIIIVGSQTYQVYLYKASFIEQYSYRGNLKHCQIYQNKGSYNFMHLALPQEITYRCKDDNALYITSYMYSERVSAIICQKKIQFFSNDQCFSYLMINYNIGSIHE